MNIDPHIVQASGITYDVLHSGVIDLRGRYSKVMNMLRSDVSQPLPVVSPTVSTNKMLHAVSPLLFTNQMMPTSQHPSWSCKRDGCSGQLTLIGNVRSHCIRVEGTYILFRIRRECFSSTTSKKIFLYLYSYTLIMHTHITVEPHVTQTP